MIHHKLNTILENTFGGNNEKEKNKIYFRQGRIEEGRIEEGLLTGLKKIGSGTIDVVSAPFKWLGSSASTIKNYTDNATGKNGQMGTDIGQMKSRADKLQPLDAETQHQAAIGFKEREHDHIRNKNQNAFRTGQDAQTAEERFKNTRQNQLNKLN